MSEPHSPVRLTVQEGVRCSALIEDLVSRTTVTEVEARELIEGASERLQRALQIKNPLRLRGSALKPERCAGLIRLAPGIELEVVPKFLRPQDETWREDFFLIATLSKVGRVFPSDMIRAGYSDQSDLATLVGRAMLSLFGENYRQPLRTYQRRTVREFAYEGEVDPEELVLPDPEGLLQEVAVLDRSNPYNAAILKAARSLLPEVRDAETRLQLVRMAELLAPQHSIRASRRPQRVPSRHRSWQPLYDLALHVLDGFGAGYDAAELYGPGFVLKTWKAWEDLVTMATRVGLQGFDVVSQHSYRLGTRTRERRRVFNVHPDIAIQEKGSRDAVLLVDAKYKARLSQGRLRVVEADVYEALAFMRASTCQNVVLTYPRLSQGAPRRPGQCERFEVIRSGGCEIHALEVECQGIYREGLGVFSQTLSGEFRNYIC